MSLYKSLKTKLVLWVWDHTPNCREMSRLSSGSLDRPLSLKRRVQMLMHFRICCWCRRYLEQIKFLRSASSCYEERIETAANQSLPTDARQRLKERLRDAGK